MKKLLCVFLTMLLCLLAGCGAEKENPLLGTWKEKDGDGVLVFDEHSVTANGVRYFEDDAENEYELFGEDVLRAKSGAQSVELLYRLEGDTLTVERDGEQSVFVRARDGSGHHKPADSDATGAGEETAVPTGTESDPNGSTEPAATAPSEPNDTTPPVSTGVPDGSEPTAPGGPAGTDSPATPAEAAPTDAGPSTTEPAPSDTASELGTLSDDQIRASLIGTWETQYKGSRLVYQFNADGTGAVSMFPMTYTVEDGVITVSVNAFGSTEVGSAAYSVEDDTLILEKDGSTLVMHKAE